jgi:hypothetical protein
LISRDNLIHVGQRSADVRAALTCGSTAVARTDIYGPMPKVTSCHASTPGGTHGPSTGPTSAPSSGHAAGGHEAPAPAQPPIGADGLLGDIGHLLGGLLG